MELFPRASVLPMEGEVGRLAEGAKGGGEGMGGRHDVDGVIDEVVELVVGKGEEIGNGLFGGSRVRAGGVGGRSG